MNRRAWLMTAFYVAALYLALPFERPVVSAFSAVVGRQYLSIFVSSAIFIFPAVAVAFSLGRRRGTGSRLRIFLLALPVAVAAAWVVYEVRLPEERLHFLEYGLLGALLSSALGRRGAGVSGVTLAIALIIVVGSADETIQHFMPSRVGEVRDVLMKTAGGAIGIWIEKLIRVDLNRRAA